MEECLTILKYLRDKYVTVMNKNLKVYEAYRQKTNFRRFYLSTDDPVLMGERVRAYSSF